MKCVQLILAGLYFTLLACQSPAKKQYEELINQNSKTKKEYSGFHQAFEATITPLNQVIQTAVLERKAELQDWPMAKLESEKKELDEKRLTHSHFFLRFFAPETQYNDLHQPDTIWKIYLVVDSQKYEASKIKKDFSKLVELSTLYPYFDRFSSGYEVEFPIGQASLDKKAYKIILTSSLGKAEFLFN